MKPPPRIVAAAAVVGVVLSVAACGGAAKVATKTATARESSAVTTSAATGGFVYKVLSGSMEPTLVAGERLLVSPTTSPEVGQIVVFDPPEEAEHEICGPKPHHVAVGGQACDATAAPEGRVRYIKRIVAGPGDEIYIRAGHVYRKPPGASAFAREPDSYIKPCAPNIGSPACSFPTPIEIPAGEWFVMGDNREESDDSRFWGPVPTAWIRGVATTPE